MVAKAFLLLCAQALFFQSISAQCLGALGAIATPCAAAPLVAAPCGLGYAGPAAALAASNGPGLAVSSASPISPVGVSVASDNAIDGLLAISGAVPFLGTVGLEGVLPTAGAGNVAYNCGNGAVAITAEDIAPLGLGVGPVGVGSLGVGPLGVGSLGVGPLGLGAESLGLGIGGLGLGVGPLGIGLGAIGCGCNAIL